eukprot:2463018-Prymnesium_polylepis.1
MLPKLTQLAQRFGLDAVSPAVADLLSLALEERLRECARAPPSNPQTRAATRRRLAGLGAAPLDAC